MYRRFFIWTLVIWNGILIFLSWGERELSLPVALPVLALGGPFVAVALFMIFQLMAFRFDYSVFGKYERTPHPNEKPICGVTGWTGRVGGASASYAGITWTVFPSGLGIAIPFYGEAFVAADQILSLKPGWFGYCKMRHSSPEVRSPIVFRSKSIEQALREIKGWEHADLESILTTATPQR